MRLTVMGINMEQIAEDKWEIVTSYMNDEIREDLHGDLAPCSRAEFFLAYEERDPELAAWLREEFEIEDDDTRQRELMVAEMREMIALGWTYEEAEQNREAFLERLGDTAEGLPWETIWQDWSFTWEAVLDEMTD